MRTIGSLLAGLLLLLLGCTPGQGEMQKTEGPELRLGYFANLTHAQAIIGLADGRLERGAGVKIKPKLFASGPAAITALLAGEIDLLYVGPSPAVTGYMRSEGEALRIVAGAASGGAVLVMRPGADPGKLDGTRLATPGIANTQDVALRHLVASQGLKPRERGGSVAITAMPPAEILGLFARGQLDGAWVAEPWGARLVQEAGGAIAVDERDLWPGGRFPTTVLAASTEYIRQHPDAVKAFIRAHVELTEWMEANPDEARRQLQAGLTQLQGKPIPESVLTDALSRITFVYDPMAEQVAIQAGHAFDLGYLGARQPDLRHLFDLSLLKEVAP